MKLLFAHERLDMTNPIKKMIDANKKHKVISGSAYQNGGGRYVLENKSVFKWTKAQMKEFISSGNEFNPIWRLS